MRELNLNDIQKLETEMLIQLTDYIDRHNLKYYLYYGTLLGAVRHKGFIPWDDDVDIIMPRPDYEALYAIMKEEPLPMGMRPTSLETNDSTYPWITVINPATKVEAVGVGTEENLWIDIFPMDGVPEDKEAETRLHNEERRLYENHYRSRYPLFKGNGLIRTVAKFPLQVYHHILGPAYYAKKMSALAQTYDYKTSKRVNQYAYDTRIIPAYDKSLLEPGVMREFEGHLFRCPTDPEQVLSITYGDYMTLPPEDRRKGNILKAWIIDENAK
ncbi:MAG: LicD family protein [Erysipelotrichales bacterium]|nr:LicD family protein [Erysipelotrichales bacterium]